ncbi:hypothetical protein FCIRC_2916 [Fusarium circinatum]|uniref:Uncharacterized protein n=1 Tax=Fusarium circinatum TaxID=48490 RepID=A0A8H5X8G4_FUSCI|nr:hypothetical protein FCIRC_2916 [Fusarium circinatum]
MEEQLQKIKMEVMQDRLDSLELRFEDLANNFAHLSTKQFSKQCISCMEAIRSLASDCLIANADDFLLSMSRAEFIEYVRDYQRSMRFDVDGSNIIKRCELETGHHRQLAEEERHDRFMSLKAGVPPAKFCFSPYNPQDLFVELAIYLENLAIKELEYHGQPYVPNVAIPNQPPPPYESQRRRFQFRGSLHRVAAAMASVKDSFGSGSSFQSVATELSEDENYKQEHFREWAQGQLAAHKKYLLLPPTPDVISDVLAHYKKARVRRWALPLGLQLHRLIPVHVEGRPGCYAYQPVIPDAEGDSSSLFKQGDVEILTTTRERLRYEYWDSGPVLEMEAPAPHPLLPDWMDEIHIPDSNDMSEFGLVVAWRYYGTEAWMNRYGHLVPEV